jgi:hypothetical protein
MSELFDLVVRRDTEGGEVLQQTMSMHSNCVKRDRIGFSMFPPLGRAKIRVYIVTIVLADREDELHVRLRNFADVVRRMLL